jgi:hypothetical protein
MAPTSGGDLEVDERMTRPAFGLEACKEKRGGKGAPAMVRWPLDEAGAHVFMQFGRTSMLTRN